MNHTDPGPPRDSPTPTGRRNDDTKDKSRVTRSRIEHAVTRARAMLRSRGLRCTEPRLTVASVLFAEPDARHLTAQQIVDRLADRGQVVDLSTVYRTLTTLVEVGVLHGLALPDRATSYGLTDHPHHHGVCTCCAAVIEIPAERLSAALDHASRGSHFQLPASAGLTLHGLCPDCQQTTDGPVAGGSTR